MPGADSGDWGDILNSFLEVSLASDGTINSNAVGFSQLQTNSIGTSQIQNNAVTNTQLDIPTQTTLAAVSSKYVKPGGGIPFTDLAGSIPASSLASSIQTNLTNASSAVQSVNTKTGNSITLAASDLNAVPTTTTINGYALSSNVNLIASDVSAIPTAELGATSGVAQLDNTGKLITGQIPGSVVSGGLLLATKNGVVGDGTTDDTLAINALIQLALTENKVVVIDTPAAMNISGTIDARGAGLVIMRTNPKVQTFNQQSLTIPSVLIGDPTGFGEQQLDLQVVYASQATNSAAVAFLGYWIFKSRLRLRSYNAAKGFAYYQGAAAASGPAAGANGGFSSIIELMAQNYSICGLDTTPFNCDNSGNVWENVILERTDGASISDYGARIYNSDNDVFNQLNIGGMLVNTAGGLLLVQGNVVINSMHVESMTLETYGGTLINCAGGTSLTINGVTLQGSTIENDSGDDKSIVQLSGSSTCTLNGLSFGNTNTYSATNFGLVNASDQTGSFFASSINSNALMHFTEIALNDTSTPPVCKRVNEHIYDSSGLPASLVTSSQSALGNLGATSTWTVTKQLEQRTGTLTANCTLMISGMTAGWTGTLLGNTGTGGFTLSINDGSGAQSVTIPTAAYESFVVWLYSENGSNIYVVPGPQVGATGANGVRGSEWFTYSGSGTPTGISGIANGDLCLRSDGEVYEYVSNAWSDTSINIKGAPGSGGGSSTNDLRLAAWGAQAEPYPIAAATGSTLLTSGRLEAALIGVIPGMTLTGIIVGLNTVAASLTGLYACLYSTAGVLLTTNSQNQSTALNSGVATAYTATQLPFFSSGTYTVPSGTTAVYAAILPVGTTPPTLYRGGNSGIDNAINGGVPLFTYQTGLAAPTSSVGLNKDINTYYIGVY
jgi:hypothetical protein